ncbi:MAG: hypothetical protein K8W52_40200 [Deltaproteobacteria bacterium]|nr:hypothetical protein [Deltaproteobacteria bacterium]
MRLVDRWSGALFLVVAGCAAGGKLMSFSSTSSSTGGAAAPASPSATSASPASGSAPAEAGSTWAAGIDPAVPRDGAYYWPRVDDGRGVVSEARAEGPVGIGKCDAPDDAAPAPSAPADPWAAVDRTVPAALPVTNHQRRGAGISGRSEVTACDAAHDHCLRACTWFARPGDQPGRQFDVYPVYRLPDGEFTEPRGGSREFTEGYVAYRTVPAAKRLLAAGRRVLVRPAVPENEAEALGTWREGVIYKFDPGAGTVQLEGSRDIYPLAATRVVVLSSQAGAPVELMNGWSAKDIVVRGDETF